MPTIPMPPQSELDRWAAAGLIRPEDARPGAAAAPARGRGPDVRTRAVVEWAVSLTLPCRVVSEANRPTGEGWPAAHRRRKRQQEALDAARLAAGFGYVGGFVPRTPCVVTLTHVGPAMDGDNLQRAFKALRDAVAAWLGVDDADPRVRWEYDQRPGPAGVELRIQRAAGARDNGGGAGCTRPTMRP